GLGAVDTGFAAFGEVTDRRARAELLDEGLAILTGLWRGQPFRHRGRHYTVEPTEFPAPPPPVQQPRIPIWVAAAWPSRRSMRRALRYDGILPMVIGDDGAARQATPDDVRAIVDHAREHRPPDAGPFDVVVEGETPGDDPAAAAAEVRRWAGAGATWWMETRWSAPDVATVRERIAQGPPSDRPGEG
ncbi:MAG TPA: LLM class flavin-dependent oxidoreductase, partial [Thermomicrobiaceae bacterium]|nr:LLM class flavin-dependent oxidoreductase [Thermomicrobiaceae bacterium]